VGAHDPVQDTPHHAVELEMSLFRQAVGDMHAGRMGCLVCRRTPLTGETITVVATTAGHGMVCDGCASTAAGRRAGPVVDRRLVGPGSGAVTVRRAA
jgi:hypothetical protein